MGEKAIKLVIVDNHAMVRLGIKKLVDFEADIKVVGEADGLSEGTSTIVELKPDVVLLDLHYRGSSIHDTLDTIQKIRKLCPSTKIVAMTAVYNDPEYYDLVRRAGALGFVSKEDAPHETLTAIRIAAKGEEYLSGTLGPAVHAMRDRGLRQKTTGRERDVLEIFLQSKGAKSDKDIAKDLGLNEYTVRTHMGSLRRKFGVTNRTALYVKASELRAAAAGLP